MITVFGHFIYTILGNLLNKPVKIYYHYPRFPDQRTKLRVGNSTRAKTEPRLSGSRDLFQVMIYLFLCSPNATSPTIMAATNGKPLLPVLGSSLLCKAVQHQSQNVPIARKFFLILSSIVSWSPLTSISPGSVLQRNIEAISQAFPMLVSSCIIIKSVFCLPQLRKMDLKQGVYVKKTSQFFFPLTMKLANIL